MIKRLIKYALPVIALLIMAGLVYRVRQDSPSFVHDTHPKVTFDQDDITFVRSLHGPDGSLIGSVYVTYTGEKMFSSLLISRIIDNKNIILYKIDRDGFFSTLGTDERLPEQVKNRFYGYEFVRTADDYIVVHLLTDGGHSVSDDVTIGWNLGKKAFEIQRPAI
jgi:hypothetical protein